MQSLLISSVFHAQTSWRRCDKGHIKIVANIEKKLVGTCDWQIESRSAFVIPLELSEYTTGQMHAPIQPPEIKKPDLR
jgi:hypothetical protein